MLAIEMLRNAFDADTAIAYVLNEDIRAFHVLQCGYYNFKD